MTRPTLKGAALVLCVLTFALGATLLVLSLWMIGARFAHPIAEGEWMTGAVHDAVERVRDGKQVYVAPSARFIPFVYTPLYYWTSALVARVCSTFVACKVVSLTATVVTGWGIFRIARLLGASSLWSAIALLLHLATYPLTIHFYDLARVDALYGAVMVSGVAILFSRPTLGTSALAGAILGLAFFAKQAGLFTFGAVVLGLFLARERKRAAVVFVAGIVVLAVVGVYVELETGGWFHYYCLKLPRAHGMKPARLTLFFIEDVPKSFAIAAGSVAVAVPPLWALLRKRDVPHGAPWQEIVLATVVAVAMASAFSFRAHAGGYPNVLVAWLPIGCAAAAVAATRAEERSRGTRTEPMTTMLLLGMASLQLLGAMFDPNDLAPRDDDARERERFIALVRKLEEGGEVWVTTTGNVTKETSAHAAALYDILRAGDHAPADILDGLEQRRFAAIFVGDPDEYDCGSATCTELTSALARNYFVAGRRHERDRNGMTGYDARPRWLLRPRKSPLPPARVEDLLVRQRVEKGFAEMMSRRTAVDVEIAPADEIEEMSAGVVRP